MIYPKFDISDFDKAEIVNQEKDMVCVEFSRGESYITAWVDCSVEESYNLDSWQREHCTRFLEIKEDSVWELTNDTSLDIEQPEGMKFIFNDHIAHLNDVLYDKGAEA